MATVADLFYETKELLYAGTRLLYDELAAGCDNTTSDITLTWMETLRPNTVLSIGGEDVLVRSWQAGPRIATVRRGWRGSTPVAHSAGEEVEVGPRFRGGRILQALKQEIAGWPTSLFRPVVVDIEVTEISTFVDLPAPYTNPLCMVDVGWKRDAYDLAWHWLPYARLRTAASYGTRQVEFGDILDTGTLRCVLGMPFDLSTWTLATDTATIGLQPEMLDIPPMGAVLRMLAFSETGRSDRSSQGEPRIATESPAGHAVQTAAALRTMLRQRIGEESARLLAKTRMRTW